MLLLVYLVFRLSNKLTPPPNHIRRYCNHWRLVIIFKFFSKQNLFLWRNVIGLWNSLSMKRPHIRRLMSD